MNLKELFSKKNKQKIVMEEEKNNYDSCYEMAKELLKLLGKDCYSHGEYASSYLETIWRIENFTITSDLRHNSFFKIMFDKTTVLEKKNGKIVRFIEGKWIDALTYIYDNKDILLEKHIEEKVEKYVNEGVWSYTFGETKFSNNDGISNVYCNNILFGTINNFTGEIKYYNDGEFCKDLVLMHLKKNLALQDKQKQKERMEQKELNDSADKLINNLLTNKIIKS